MRFEIRKITTPAKEWLNENALTPFTKKLLPFSVSDYYLVDNEKTWVYCSPIPIMVNSWCLGSQFNHNLDLTEHETDELFELERLSEDDYHLCIGEGEFVEFPAIDLSEFDLNDNVDYNDCIISIIEYYLGNPSW